MLIMPKTDEKADHKGIAPAVSEVSGYTFGVWGLSDNEDVASEFSRDQQLLAVDAAVMLGEIKGQHTIDAEIRFVPLRDGPIYVPNFKLYDKTEGKWFNCVHKLCVVADARSKLLSHTLARYSLLSLRCFDD